MIKNSNAHTEDLSFHMPKFGFQKAFNIFTLKKEILVKMETIDSIYTNTSLERMELKVLLTLLTKMLKV